MKSLNVKFFISFFLLSVFYCSSNCLAAQKYGLIDYTSATQTEAAWIAQKFSFKVEGATPNNSNLMWMHYRDIFTSESITRYLEMKDWAVTNSQNYEKMLLHSKVDFIAPVATPWFQMDKFDNFEGAKGVMRTSDDVAYTDFTSTAYSGNVAWQNTMYIGYEEPFDQINLVFSTAGNGITRVWEYWNGSAWVTLTVTDGTSSLTTNGQVYFQPPSAWSKKTINGSRNKYFVRCRITAASTTPITSSVKGDSWSNGSATALRGWSFTDGNRINIGMPLEYNPAPPAGSSAKFPYQARLPFWGENHFTYNTAYTVNSVRVVMRYLADYILTAVPAAGYTGMMMDDGEVSEFQDKTGAVQADTDWYDYTSNTCEQENIAKYSALVSMVHAGNSNIKMGINAKSKSIAGSGDWNLHEYFNYNHKTNDSILMAANSSSVMTYDDYLPVNNPNGTIGVLLYSDGYRTPQGAFFDGGNRGPIVALTKHLIGQNVNTYFGYNSAGGYSYGENDDVILNDTSVGHQSAGTIPAYSTVARWGTYFPAMGVDFGVPDTNGYNGGIRNLSWIPSDDARVADGTGYAMAVWRRDYTNAVILHRPADSYTTKLQYETPSAAIDLGGTYYPLYADGTTGAAITIITLRAGEGAILMKAPIASPVNNPPITTPSKLSGNYKATQTVTLTTTGTSIKYCLTTGTSCTPTTTYSAAFKVLKNAAKQTYCVQSTDGTNNEAIKCYTLTKKKKTRR